MRAGSRGLIFHFLHTPPNGGVGVLKGMQALRSNLDLKCPLCGQAGFAVWEDDGENKPRQLVHVSRGFHPEIGRTTSGEPLIVCNDCDHIQD